MKLLEEKILKEGIAVDEDILRVDGFINHQIDPAFMQQIGPTLQTILRVVELQK